jgi:hypothetical protein
MAMIAVCGHTLKRPRLRPLRAASLRAVEQQRVGVGPHAQ